MKDLYEILGVPKDATEAVIKTVHRALAKQYHPDNGGDQDDFDEIQKAYKVLIDATKRKKYDETGYYDFRAEQPSIETKASGVIAGAFEAIIVDRGVPDTQDPLEIVRMFIEKSIGEQETEKKEFLLKIARIDNALGRLTRKAQAEPGGTDFIVAALQRRQEMLRVGLAEREEHLEVGQLALELLKQYSFKVDHPMYPGTTATMGQQQQGGTFFKIFGAGASAT